MRRPGVSRNYIAGLSSRDPEHSKHVPLALADIGKVMARYYISFETMKLMTVLSPDKSIADLVCGAMWLPETFSL
jgi:hypothetical protein